MTLSDRLHSEPVQTIVVPIVVALAGVLVARGFIDSDIADVVLSLVFLVTGVTGVRLARNRVIPVGKAREIVEGTITDVIDHFADNTGAVSGLTATAVETTATEASRRIRDAAAHVRVTPPPGL